MNEVVLSIIVPVYKVELYLEDCIKSILDQSFENFELILIDDGSPDNCGAICEEYAKRDKRIKVIHQENSGLSAARNSGLGLAKGKYVTFIDSDDTIHPGTFQDNMNVLLGDESIDLLEYPIYVYYGSDEEYILKEDSQHIYGTEVIFSNWIENKGYLHSYACNKIYKRDIFDEIRFPVGKSFEDSYAIFDILKKVGHLYISDKGLYYYFKRETSITALPSYRKIKDLLESHIRIWQNLDNYPISKNGIFTYYLFISNIVIDLMDYKEKDFAYKEYVMKELSTISFSVKDLWKINVPKRMKYKNVSLILLGLRAHCKFYNLLHTLMK